jgi:heme/copper-type cytochrome/quinol oxidase subunit 4
VPTIATGILAWQLQFEGKAPKGNLKLHMILALSSSVMIWLVCWLHIKEQRKPQFNSSAVRLTVEVVAVALTMLTGHVGGFVSGVSGPN